MNKSLKILWVDDEWPAQNEDGNNFTPNILACYLNELRFALNNDGIFLNIKTRNSLDIVDDLANEAYDILLLDYELVAGSEKTTDNAFGLLDKLTRNLIHVPPAVLFTRYGSLVTQMSSSGATHAGRIIGVFERTKLGLTKLIDLLKELVLTPPITFLVLSDMHAGYLGQSKGLDSRRYIDSLEADLIKLRGQETIDYLLLPGDLAWRHQSSDFLEAYGWISRIRSALQLGRPGQFHFCPGNHDADLTSGQPDWQSFGDFVNLLASTDHQFEQRYVAYDVKGRHLHRFFEREMTLSVGHDDYKGVTVASLNSCALLNGDKSFHAEVGDVQWNKLERIMETMPIGSVRIGLMHHPLFSAPGGAEIEERAIADQGKALHMFTKLGIGLVFHGHAHYSAIHEHRVAILNRAGENDKARISKVVVVSCPTALALPSGSSPQRQYMIVQLGRYNVEKNGRTLSLRSRVFDPTDCTWHSGVSIDDSHFVVECPITLNHQS